MAYKLTWLDDKESITLLEVIQPWDWSEFDESMSRTHELVRSKDYVVDGIIVFGQDFKLPDPNLLQHARPLYGNVPKNSGITVVVGASHFIKTVVQILDRALGGRLNFNYANTMEEAQALIDQRRAK